MIAVCAAGGADGRLLCPVSLSRDGHAQRAADEVPSRQRVGKIFYPIASRGSRTYVWCTHFNSPVSVSSVRFLHDTPLDGTGSSPSSGYRNVGRVLLEPGL
jgi:hypothetical protein